MKNHKNRPALEAPDHLYAFGGTCIISPILLRIPRCALNYNQRFRVT